MDEIAFARDMVALRRPLRLKGRWSPPKDGLYRVATSKKVYVAIKGNHHVVSELHARQARLAMDSPWAQRLQLAKEERRS